MGSWKDWAQLVRIPNTLTACADSLAGFSIVAGAWNPTIYPSLCFIGCASISLYWAGMVLNDVNDIEQDKIDRRRGPLVDSRIGWQSARLTGWSLIVAGVVFALLSGLFSKGVGSVDSDAISNAAWPAMLAIVLAVCIVCYDSALKKTPLGPWLMGMCRTLNLAMGMTLGATTLADVGDTFERLSYAAWLIPFGHGLFVVGLTMAARKESTVFQSKSKLAMSWSVSLIGIIFLAVSSRFVSNDVALRLDSTTVFPLLIALISAPWLLRAIHSVRSASVPNLVIAIKQAILTILFLDAGLTLQFAGNGPGLFVCALAIPTFALGKWFRMT